MTILVHFQVNSGRRKESLDDDEDDLEDDMFGETIEVSLAHWCHNCNSLWLMTSCTSIMILFIWYNTEPNFQSILGS